MKQFRKDPARKFHRLSKERHLDLNKLMCEHFCSDKPAKKRNHKAKRKSKNNKKK